jgi:NAD(P)-dependent dehydrogenase (short-subunit alcohol dehydrogenase family)
MESQGDEKQAEDAGLVVVTGGATSVGRATALAFAEAGWRVFVADRSEEAIAALTHTAITARCVDVMDEGAVASFFAEVRGSGPVEVLVNTVGLGGPRGLAEELSYEDFMATIAGSAGATFLCCREVIPQMKARGRGAIINFSSSSTRTGLPGRTAYIAAKGALEAMTRNLARELGPFGVRINAILPGAIDNPRLDALIRAGAAERGESPEAFERHLLRFISMRTRIAVEDLAATVLFLASPAARHITGQLLGVDGNAEWEE